MSITYRWKVTGMKVRDADNLSQAVFQTYWQKIGQDENGNEGVFSGATPFDVEKIDPNNFTPLEQLTEEQVLGWIQEVVVGSYEEHVNGQIAKQILEKTTVMKEVKLPWATEEPAGMPSAPSKPVP